ncbi:MAG: parallel beta-helix repeat protein [Cyclobacteriaceae bacterium]|jgi:parallel beta-helix repeat protein
MKAFYFLCGFIFLWSCNARSGKETVWKSIEKDLQTQLITSSDSTTIELPEGNFMFTRSLLLDGKSNITIKGAGIDKTVLSFAMQEEGAEGLKISNASSVVLEDFTIQDAKGDNIKVTDTEGITFRRVKSEWTGEPKATNGAYAFYPVLSKHVIIEDCIAIGASDAGIYVGQSDSVIIRNNTVYFNVAGIESENSRWVEIYGNETYDNTGGILVFDLPGLTQTGHTTRVYDNKIYRNNYKNFAPEGNIVATVPPGTGLMLLATRNIEIFDNEIIDNRTVGIAIASYDLVAAIGGEGTANPDTGIPQAQQAAYIPYYNDLYIHHNKINNSYWFPTLKNDFGLLFLTKFLLSTPDIVIDGITGGEELRICLEDNGEASFANLDAGNDFAALNNDIAAVTCFGDVIPPVFP